MPKPSKEGSPTPRQRRRPRGELEELLLAAGQELLLRDGPSLGLEEITFKRVFEHLEQASGVRVTHASVIGRIWDNQSDFQTSLLTSILLQQTNEEPAVRLALAKLEEVVSGADLSSEEGRWAALTELCREGAEENLKLLRGDRWWPLRMNAWASIAMHDHPAEEAFGGLLSAGYRDGNEAFAGLVALVIERLGFQLCNGCSLEELCVMLGSAAEGAGIRHRVAPTAVELGQRAGTRWTTLGLSYLAISRFALEPIPGWSPTEGKP